MCNLYRQRSDPQAILDLSRAEAGERGAPYRDLTPRT